MSLVGAATSLLDYSSLNTESKISFLTMNASTSDSGRRMTSLKLNILNLLAYIVNVVVTYGIGVAGFFGLPTNGELSAKYQTLVTPIGWAFAIWAVIFLLQLVWSIAQIVGKFRESEYVTSVGYGYVMVVAAQVGWTLSFSTEVIWLSLAFMVALWVFLLRIVLKLAKAGSPSVGEYLLWKLPFTIHCGWITAATAVNLNVLLVSLGLSSGLQFYIALASVAAILVVGLGFVGMRIDLVVPVVLAWALVGVYVELLSPTESISGSFSNSEIKQVRYLGAGVAISLILSVCVQTVCNLASKKRRNNGRSQSSDYHRQDDI